MPNLRLAAGLAAALSSLAIAGAAPQITEFIALNQSVRADGDGDFSDWIEIHNPEGVSLEIGGYYLTDDALDLGHWRFPAGTTIPGGGYLLVFASNKVIAPPGELHASFRLAGGGEYLALIAPDRQTIIQDFAPAFPPQFVDISYGIGSGGAARYFTTPTPGAANFGGISDPAAEVVFSPPGGTFAGSLMVTMAAANPAAAIHYTTDGSDPDVGSPVYGGALTLGAATRIRARLIVAGEEPGPINSASYLRLGADVQGFSSPLPIVVLDNFGAGAIPDKRAANPPASDGSGITQVPRQPAVLAIIDRDGGGTAHLADPATISTRIGVRVRGSSSASQPAKKENYSIETWGAVDGEQVEITAFGMPADNDWILYAPYNYDRALVRNTVSYEVMRQMGHYASRTQFVEVFVNTEGGDITMADFAGVFVFMEKLKQGGKRVRIDDLAPDGTSGGWLIESNRKDPLPEDGSGTPPYNFHTAGPNRIKQGPYGGSSGADQGGDDIPTGYNTFFNFVEPSGYRTTQAQRDSIVAWFDSFEDALYSTNYRRTDLGYRAWLDVRTFIDHQLLVNLTRSVDGLQLSTFLYRPSTHGKLHLNPPWDFDRAMDSYDGRDDSTSGMWAQNFLWFPRLFSDPEFGQQYIDRWQELRRGPLATANLHALIDAMAAEITTPVAAANFARWNASNNQPRSGGWPAEIAHLKAWLASRAAWIDGQFPAPPELSESAQAVTITSPDAGTIYYTLDGTDPRRPDVPGVDLELIPEGAAARGLVPGVANGGDHLGAAWKGGFEPFDDSGWLAGSTGLGFGYAGLVGIDVTAMRGQTGSAYLRVPFTLDGATLASLGSLTLNMKYEDGFVAWINGVEVGSANKPNPLAWNSATGVTRLDSDAIVFQPFDLSAYLGALRPGVNILAIQAMNSSVSNADLLALPQLLANTGSYGGVSPRAMAYTGPVTLTQATRITARLEKNGAWSGPVAVTYLIDTVPADGTNLVLSEFMYRPADASPAEQLAGISDRDEFEFVELMNISADETIDLSGVRFVETDNGGDLQGIVFDFAEAEILFLRPGERLVVVENREAIVLRYGPGRPIAGQYRGNLSNDGERITILDQNGAVIRDFIYNDQLPWPTAADGEGYSLVLTAPAANPEHGIALNWRPSSGKGGTPGGGEGVVFTGDPDADDDGDGLDALVEFALGSSDQDRASGRDRYGVAQVGGEPVFSARRSLLARDVVVTVEYSTDLETWREDPGDGSLLGLIERAHNGDGTESLAWRPAAPGFRGFIRLRVTQGVVP